jgi:hypothetical protein
LRRVEEDKGERPNIRWRPFVLAQANSKAGADWKAWERPADEKVRGMLAHIAGIAAMRQGEALYDAFHDGLLQARHVERKNLDDPDVLLDIAKGSGLDVGRLQEDMRDPSILNTIGESHTEATQKYGAFGVPTFAFDNGGSVFLKMFYPSKDEAGEMYDGLVKMMSQWVNIGELKRPQPPWPAGVTPAS